MNGPARSELDEMLEGIAPVTPPVEEPPVVEPPVVEPPTTEPPTTEPPVEPPVEPVVAPPAEPPVEEPPVVEPPIEPPLVEPPVVEPPVTEPPVEPPVEPPIEETPAQTVARLEEQNRLLMERVEHLSTPQEFRYAQPPAQEPAQPEVAPPGTVVTPPAIAPEPAIPVPAPVVQPETPAEQKLFDFIRGRDLETVIDDPGELNVLLNEVVAQAGTRNVDVVVEKILTSIPNLVAGQIVQQNSLNKMVNDFYTANPDLTPVKRTVAAFVNEVHAEHPDWEATQVFNESATRSRKALGLKERALRRSEPSEPVAPINSPAFARQRGARRGAEPELTGMAGEIDEMLKIP